MSAKILIIMSILVLAVVPTAAARTLRLEVFLHEYAGGLQVLPGSIEANVGETIEASVYNLGESPHNLVFCGDPTGPMEKCNTEWGSTPNIEPNGTAKLSVILSKGGSFDYYCSLPGHKGLGMTSVLHVSGDSADLKKDSPGAPAWALLGLVLVALLIRRRSS